MKWLLVAGLALVLTIAQPSRAEDDWESVFGKVNDVLFKCFQKEMMHSIEAGVDTKGYAKILPVLCKREMEMWVQVAYSLFRAKGHSDEWTRQKGSELLAQTTADLLRIYDDLYKKGRRNK